MSLRSKLYGGEECSRGGLILRRMALEDLEAVMEIERAAFAHPWSLDLVRRELTHEWSTIVVGLRRVEGSADRLVGFVIFWVVHDEIHVLNVAVDPAERRRGVARTLLEETLERARKVDAALATLEVRRSNAAAIGLYAALGFREVGVRPRYYSDEGEDAILMTLEL